MIEEIQNAILKTLEDDRRNGTLIQGKLHFIDGERIRCKPAYLRTVIDGGFRKKLGSLNYQYVISHSTDEHVCFIDTTPIRKVCENCIMIEQPFYDEERQEVTSNIIRKEPIENTTDKL